MFFQNQGPSFLSTDGVLASLNKSEKIFSLNLDVKRLKELNRRKTKKHTRVITITTKMLFLLICTYSVFRSVFSLNTKFIAVFTVLMSELHIAGKSELNTDPNFFHKSLVILCSSKKSQFDPYFLEIVPCIEYPLGHKNQFA